MMMTALAIHGVQMGPMLLRAQPEYLTATFASMVLANIIMVFVSFVIAKGFSKILKMPYYILGSFILILAMTGCYSYQKSIIDVYLMVFGGIFGYYFKEYNFNVPALILGLVLGPMTEKHFRRGMALNDNNIIEFFSSPIVFVIMFAFVVIYAYYIYMSFKKRKAKELV